MTEIQYRNITRADDPALEQVAVLFRQLYQQLAAQGQINKLPKNGEQLWLKSVKRSLNKLGGVIVAEKGEQLIGFINGQIRFLPEFLGGAKQGFLAHQFIIGEYRKSGVGSQLHQELLKWFRQKGIRQVELYVNTGNETGKAFYQSEGYQAEWLQMRKIMDGSHE
ncbi:MAG: GNAT family N-acetyltransferase [Bacteroidales bacterium]|nr:GNAT family N-acetyltransferase [Bacteroidales bacterium]MCF8344273.1 GNAT family N-acetyltransferase [Bacteroidales bacterium]MCF8351657.1 GNAT family N-acetyltransferase [Bacteroidales bacterium]MCF8375520.1 GNAT family N-acetyltransferase [Bacteroidales bacterium]MCF8399919.1 GNAT family N-acetyltransferase [Bacteroidales bacterium]